MRHKVAGVKLGKKDFAKSLRRTLICQLFTHERIRTTRAKAKAIRGEAERLVTLAKKGLAGSEVDQVNARRRAAAKLGNRPEVVKKLFDEIAPRFEDRNGGYTRVFRLGPRQGDAAEMVILEFVED